MNLENKDEDDRFVLENIILGTNYLTHMGIKVRQYTTSKDTINPNAIAIELAKDMFSPTESTLFLVSALVVIRQIGDTFLKKEK